MSLITKLLNINLPIIQAPMAGGATTPELIAAVSNAGGLGSLGAGYMDPDAIKTAIQHIKRLTTKPFAVNLFIPEKHSATAKQVQDMQEIILRNCYELHLDLPPIYPPYLPNFDEQMEIILHENVPVFSFTFGLLQVHWLNKLNTNGTILIGTATNCDEARLLETQKVDLIVMQGLEAGGHRGTFVKKAEDSLFPVLSLIKNGVTSVKTPLIAAGGINTHNKINAVLSAGAKAVQIGSAFLTCPECGIASAYKEKLSSLNTDKTVLTRTFSGKLARGIDNTFITRMKPDEAKILDYPIQNALTRHMRKIAEQQNNPEFMSMWAGQSAHLGEALNASQLMKKLSGLKTDSKELK